MKWKRSAKITLILKNKLGFVTGKPKQHVSDSPDAASWERCNNLIISWLLHSIEPDIATSVQYCKNAAYIWKDLEDRFAQSSAPRLYQVQKQLANFSQGHNYVPTYFT